MQNCLLQPVSKRGQTKQNNNKKAIQLYTYSPELPVVSCYFCVLSKQFQSKPFQPPSCALLLPRGLLASIEKSVLICSLSPAPPRQLLNGERPAGKKSHYSFLPWPNINSSHLFLLLFLYCYNHSNVKLHFAASVSACFLCVCVCFFFYVAFLFL